MTKKVDGNLTISKVSSNMSDDLIAITLKDKLSGNVVVTAEVSLNDFAETLTGTAFVPATLYVEDEVIETVGKKREIKQVHIPMGLYTTRKDFRKQIKENAKKEEIDGWVLRDEDYNSKRMLNGTYLCTFIRYVEVENETV